MRDQDIDFACLTDEGDELRPMRLRYGVTADEASHHEPLDLSLSQEESELSIAEDGVWDEVEMTPPAAVRTRPPAIADDLDEEQVAPGAEQAALHLDVAYE